MACGAEPSLGATESSDAGGPPTPSPHLVDTPLSPQGPNSEGAADPSGPLPEDPGAGAVASDNPAAIPGPSKRKWGGHKNRIPPALVGEAPPPDAPKPKGPAEWKDIGSHTSQKDFLMERILAKDTSELFRTECLRRLHDMENWRAGVGGIGDLMQKSNDELMKEWYGFVLPLLEQFQYLDHKGFHTGHGIQAHGFSDPKVREKARLARKARKSTREREKKREALAV